MSTVHSEFPTPRIRLDGNGWGIEGPIVLDSHHSTLAAWEPGDLHRVIAEAEQAAAKGFHVVGFLSYEAANALNPSLPSMPPLPFLPLAWFAMFRGTLPAKPPLPISKQVKLEPGTGVNAYYQAMQRALAYIAAGDCYQVNLTFPLSGRFDGSPKHLYNRLLHTQRPSYGACIDAGPFSILSLSPELFFRRRNDSIETRPMKGTAVRGRFPAEDIMLAELLRKNPKEQAENLMIVDLLRNDLGMVAETGSVQVPHLFAVESLPTVHQMTSTVTGRLRRDRSLLELLTALFPCGSVTGAPKRRSMEIIAGLENRPRGIYCGAIGYLHPGGISTFSVAIRTMLIDRISRSALLGVGSGITSDSKPDAEYRECLAKGAFITMPPAAAGLIESLRLEDNRYPLLERHLQRLAWSAGRLGIPCDTVEARRLLEKVRTFNGTRKVRLHLDPEGSFSVTSVQLAEERRPLALAVDSNHPVDPQELLLYLKTDRRERYDAARSRHPDADEVLLVNCRGELTEGSYNSIVLEIDGKMLTPPLSSGLLPGIFREELLADGTIEEKILYPSDLQRAENIWLINAVRGWRQGCLLA